MAKYMRLIYSHIMIQSQSHSPEGQDPPEVAPSYEGLPVDVPMSRKGNDNRQNNLNSHDAVPNLTSVSPLSGESVRESQVLQPLPAADGDGNPRSDRSLLASAQAVIRLHSSLRPCDRKGGRWLFHLSSAGLFCTGLARADQQRLAAELADGGLTLRSIASVIGVHNSQLSRWAVAAHLPKPVSKRVQREAEEGVRAKVMAAHMARAEKARQFPLISDALIEADMHIKDMLILADRLEKSLAAGSTVGPSEFGMARRLGAKRAVAESRWAAISEKLSAQS